MDQEYHTPHEAYDIDQIVDYKVRNIFSNYCELIDEKTGISTYLKGTTNLQLHKGQTIKCRVTELKDKRPKVELVDIENFTKNSDSLTEEKLTGILSSKEVTWSINAFVKLLLSEEKEKPFESQCHEWIQTLISKKIDLQTVRRDSSDLLEMSDLLKNCNSDERGIYQDRLTFIIEQTGYYIEAEKLIENEATGQETSTQFIDGLFSKLKVSGYVYHPDENFSILSAIFLLEPKLMQSRIKELLDIISDKEIHFWKSEPFRSALINLLELYIRECDGQIDKTKNNRDLIDNNMLALAIQLLLLKESNHPSLADYRLNSARLCILSSYLAPKSTVDLLDAAYYYLLHSSAKLPAYSFPIQVSHLPHFIINSPHSNIDTSNIFSSGRGSLLVSEKGICLQTSGNNGKLRPALPEKLELWKGLQIFLPTKTETSLVTAKSNTIAPYQSVWSEIESEFFNVKKAPVANVNKKIRQHKTGEIVKITFTRQDDKDRNKYYCQIEDEIGGTGFIYTNDIVPYPITTSLSHFYSSDGSRFVFPAQIIGRDDTQFHFSMYDDVKEFCANRYSDTEDFLCFVMGDPNSYGAAPAISTEGVSVSIRNADSIEGLKRYKTVRCRSVVTCQDRRFHLTCDAVDLCDIKLDIITAFKRLITDKAIGKIPEDITEQEEDQVLESDRLIEESYVREIICMIDRMALIDSDYVNSFNYLGFARLLCLMLGWESQAAYYKGRMDIIAMLHDFAQNSQVDEEKIAQLENANSELFSNNDVLRERFMQLQTVSFMGKENHNSELFKIARDLPSLKSLALLVLAYNITSDNGLDSCATDIRNKVIQLLNLKGYESGLKEYGKEYETEVVEYKTSFIYPAEDGGSLPNPEKQKVEVLKVIDSFFNTKGGTLYIGVNNYGYGIGIEQDLRAPLYYGDKDKYLRSVVDAVALEWGNAIATTYMSIDYDNENNEKDVLIVKVKPIPEGVPYNGHWYVRIGGTKRSLTEKEFNDYQKVNRRSENGTQEEDPKEQKPEPNQELLSVTKPLISSKEDEIKTSRIRKNILFDYLENYVEPIALFKFLGNNKFKKIKDYDYDDQSLLTLTVLEQEANGFLVLGYRNGHIVKVSVDELLDFQDREYPRYSGDKLMFASIASDDDAVLSISKESKGQSKVVMRLDPLSGFEEERLMDSGELPFNEGLASETLAFEIIPCKDIAFFRGILNRPKTLPGLPENISTKEMIKRLRSWGITEI